MKQIRQIFLEGESPILDNIVFIIKVTSFSEKTMKLLKLD